MATMRGRAAVHTGLTEDLVHAKAYCAGAAHTTADLDKNRQGRVGGHGACAMCAMSTGVFHSQGVRQKDRWRLHGATRGRGTAGGKREGTGSACDGLGLRVGLGNQREHQIGAAKGPGLCVLADAPRRKRLGGRGGMRLGVSHRHGIRVCLGPCAALRLAATAHRRRTRSLRGRVRLHACACLSTPPLARPGKLQLRWEGRRRADGVLRAWATVRMHGGRRGGGDCAGCAPQRMPLPNCAGCGTQAECSGLQSCRRTRPRRRWQLHKAHHAYDLMARRPVRRGCRRAGVCVLM